MALRGLLLLSMAISAPPAYERHDPIVIENHPTTPDAPLIIEGYEISNPDGPGIQVRDTDYVVIRNNHLHDCGTNISARRQQLVTETGDARKAMLDAPFETGAILVFDAKGSVVISGNRVHDNDYGIMVQGHRFRASCVTIHANHVRDNHRAAFVWVGQADRVEISDNVVKDNGLNLFYDNEGLVRAMQKGEDFGDGRSQGILAKDCHNVRIFQNTIVNSISDGIGIMNRGLIFDENRRLQFDPKYEEHLVHDIEIFDNWIERNGEQGIWITSAKRGRVFRNTVIANAHRRGVTGGSSGILLEGDVSEFEIFENEISWNDIFGIGLISSSNNVIRHNRIHHNGDGGIGWSEQGYLEQRPSADNLIEGNAIHDNRVAAFVVWCETLGRTVLKNNRIANNGGNPIHFEFYDDHDVRNHPDDWRLDGDPVVFKLAADELMERFEIQDAPRDQHGNQGTGFLLALFVSTGLLLVVLSIPMVLRRVPPNRWYGFRVQATLEDEDIWYSANAYAGKGIFWVGVGNVVVAVALFLFPVSNINVYASAVGGFVTVGLAVTMFLSFRHLRRRLVEG
jgi:parallel beta-helix repeat protein